MVDGQTMLSPRYDLGLASVLLLPASSSFLLRLDVAVIIDLTLLLIDGFIRCTLEYRVRLVYDLSAK